MNKIGQRVEKGMMENGKECHRLGGTNLGGRVGEIIETGRLQKKPRSLLRKLSLQLKNSPKLLLVWKSR